MPEALSPPRRAANDGSGANLFGFEADGARARAIDQRVREGLAESLEAIFTAVADDVALEADALARLVSSIRQRPVPPVVFGLYSDLVRAVREDDVPAMARLSGELAHPTHLQPLPRRVYNLSDDQLGRGRAAHFVRLLDDDPDTELPLEALNPERFAEGESLVQSALELLEEAAPELAREIEVFGQQIVLADREPGPLIFGGASTFFLWGAVFLNPAAVPTRVRMAEALTHEASHLLLFGMTHGNPMVENSDDERYASPLRPDPRPMEGIVHATYVLARMTWCLDRLATWRGLSEEERTKLTAARAENARLYSDGLRIVREQARFTEAGGRASAECLAAYPQ